METNNNLVIVRGGGDIASGTIMKLYQCGYSVLILEIEHPSAIRRNVAFSEAIYQETQTIEDVTCYYAKTYAEVCDNLGAGKLTVCIDPDGEYIEKLHPLFVVDAILAKKNLGTSRSMANIVVALGPGFTAGVDCDAVIETMRGHSLGRVIYDGAAKPNTGVPGPIAGYAKERVIHSPAAGILRNVSSITSTVKKGEVIAYIEPKIEQEIEKDNKNANEKIEVVATIDGILRGLIRDGYPVTEGFKIADIDPRINEYNNCFTISDKARCIAGGVLEAMLHLKKEKNL